MTWEPLLGICPKEVKSLCQRDARTPELVQHCLLEPRHWDAHVEVGGRWGKKCELSGNMPQPPKLLPCAPTAGENPER